MVYTQNFNIPEKVSRVTSALQQAGYEAYIVGGCVRDMCMGITPKDWDITTNATPEQVIPLFAKAVHENNFGMVAIIDEEEPLESPFRSIEVTTYRSETTYTNNRHPDHITYAQTLREDVRRRDFTMNALAYDVEKGELIDYYDGLKAIQEKLIVTVENPHDRFEEDALRIMRAIRFTAQLGFHIEPQTEQALSAYAQNLSTISVERIRDEFVKLIMSAHPMHGLQKAHTLGIMHYISPELIEGVGVDQSRNHVYDVWEHNLRALQKTADEQWPLYLRLAALFHDVGKPRTRRRDTKKNIYTFYGHEVVGAKMTKEFMKRLRFPKKTTDEVVKLVRYHMFFSDPEQITLSAVRRMITHVGKEYIWDLMKLRRADRIGMGRPQAAPYRLRKYEAMIEQALRDPISVQQLNING
ncbi:MAG: CCA tRNA nucleotidyltransferase, partial [Candidatus Pacebacteria bacterium]|nr:CCA tRNA nucleotidyltransferase [Candidatus Paceibacterota bacterium]